MSDILSGKDIRNKEGSPSLSLRKNCGKGNKKK